MSVTATVLFDRPHTAIASLINSKIAASTSTSIVTGFATPGGLAAIDRPIRANPGKLKSLVVGAATYPAFKALDGLIAAHVPLSRLRIYLGHTKPTTGRHPFARHHPMLHSKVYYMELPNEHACAFIGSHNMTAFALTGQNGEAAVMLEGPLNSPEFEQVRSHIAAAEAKAIQYDPSLKHAYAWWAKQYYEGVSVEFEVGVPRDWNSIRTILIFAEAASSDRLDIGDTFFFELPSGIQIESLKTEVHLFLFNILPASPFDALNQVEQADAKYTCITLGADDEQGNAEVRADWQIDRTPTPRLQAVLGGTYRPTTPSDMQQVRAKVQSKAVPLFEYGFERETGEWEPVYTESLNDRLPPIPSFLENKVTFNEARGNRPTGDWTLVAGLTPKKGAKMEADEAALERARPDADVFALVSLRRRELK
ncbi:phospholipase D family protein [Microvirga guangxiensis]|uniref:Uncharacterized protein n=1 Tax=Microvirga guangxiensis TaxID=549386 RepID=A0A1G5F6N9_9HYPH|nr:phospholipase D family protein [Microvirga guangxiensis]SCY34308.1 hypothetical protein SAMN02927923_01221 [Microvirga guangxiensis]